MSRLDKAIRDFEDENSDLTMGERISNLRTALSWAAFERIKTIHKLGTKAEESIEEDYKQTECQKKFKIIDQMYNSQLKQNKLTGKANEDGMGEEFLRKIKEQKSSIGDIVRDIDSVNNRN